MDITTEIDILPMIDTVKNIKEIENIDTDISIDTIFNKINYSNILTNCLINVENLFKQYESNPYMISRLTNILTSQLPQVLTNAEKQYNDRQQRIQDLTIIQDGFIQKFLSTNNLFYCEKTEFFFYYDGVRYFIHNEDDILHLILSSISKYQTNLLNWKKKTKITIMQKIKNNNIMRSMPESQTIQRVLELLYPTFFPSRTYAKYFLIVIGDNMFKKNTNLVHLINSVSKTFIRELNYCCNNIFGVNLYQSFKHKYHEHEYNNCRLINVNECLRIEDIWTPIITNHALDILCVATHYSERYESSDKFIMDYCNDAHIKNNILFLKNNTKEMIVDAFIKEYIQLPSDTDADNDGKPEAPTRTFDETPKSPKTMRIKMRSNSLTEPISNSVVCASISSSSSSKKSGIDFPALYKRNSQHGNSSITTILSDKNISVITWKNLQYLWKRYLTHNNLPNIIFQQTLKDIIILKLPQFYNEQTDDFRGVYSKYLPIIEKFIKFWDEPMIHDDREVDFEVDEISTLFKIWCSDTNIQIVLLNETTIIDLVAYYYPSVDIKNNKFIHKISSLLWKKREDIDCAIKSLKQKISENGSAEIQLVSVYDAYNYYISHCSSRELCELQRANGIPKNNLIVSKSYFEKYVLDVYNDFIIC
jgi:hypothetical protein